MVLHPVFLLLGSNIQPETNIRAGLQSLKNEVILQSISRVWETPAVGSSGANFLNMAVKIATDFEPETLKYQVLRSIEARLGRVRSADKNAPRTIDMDILIYDRIILEPNIWQQAYIACPLADLLPDLVEPQSGISLRQLANDFQLIKPVRLRTDIQIGTD